MTFRRERWEDEPYRKLFQTVYNELALRLDEDALKNWKEGFFKKFLRSHSVLPNCSSERFWQSRKRVWQWTILQNRYVAKIQHELSDWTEWEMDDKFPNWGTKVIRIDNKNWELTGSFLYPKTLRYNFSNKTVSQIIVKLQQKVNSFKALSSADYSQTALRVGV